MVEMRKSENTKEHEEIDVTNADRNMQHRKEESNKKLETSSSQMCDMNEVRYDAKRHRSAFNAHKNPHIPRSPPPRPSTRQVQED
jgi:hypothetical protein